MSIRTGLKALYISGLVFALCGCGHRAGTSAVAKTPKPVTTQPVMLSITAANHKTFQSSPAAIQFDYPICWAPCKNHTADFTIEGPITPTQCKPTLCLDIPKLPWHIPGMIPIAMVTHGYVNDLRANLMPDAAVCDESTINVGNATARRVCCKGHLNGKAWNDVAVIMIHADQVYILSADSDDTGKTTARQTLDDAISSLKWLK